MPQRQGGTTESHEGLLYREDDCEMSEWCTDDDDCPEYARAYGSPTILVNQVDVTGRPSGDGPSCRVYRDEDGSLAGAPTAETIARALMSPPHTTTDGGRFSWKGLSSTAPALGLAFLPKIACPACWPAYAGVLGTLGVSFLVDTRILFALTAAFLAIALFFLGYRASSRRGFGPLVLGLCASVVLLTGKFYFESDAAMFSGVGLLMVASLWNSWPRRENTPECSSCKPSTQIRRPLVGGNNQ